MTAAQKKSLRVFSACSICGATLVTLLGLVLSVCFPNHVHASAVVVGAFCIPMAIHVGVTAITMCVFRCQNRKALNH